VTAPATVPLRYPQFRNLWMASIVSNLGSFLQVVAASWLMLELTGSAFWVGLMVAAPSLPLLVVAMPAGAMADLFERRRIILVSQVVMAVTAAFTAALGFAGLLTPPILLSLGLLLGVGTAFNLPSWQAMVPDLVPNAHVASAVALNSAAFNVARAVGPALGGALVATAGAEVAFALNAVSYMAVAVAVARFPRRAIDADHEPMGTAIAVGLRYARFTPAYRWLLAVAASFAITSAVVQAVLPTLTAEQFGGGADRYGLLLGAMGVGALIGAFTRPGVATRLRGLMVPGGIAVFGVAGVALGLSTSLAGALPAMVVAGVLWVWILATLNATSQLMAPAWVRGRIMSLYTLSFVGLVPIGSILAGAIAGAIGAGPAVVALSVGTVVLGLVVGRVPLPVLADVVSPQPADLPVGRHTADDSIVGAVLVVNTWTIRPEDRPAFVAVMEELRRVRLRTGAFRWRLYRAVEDPDRISELFVLPSWAEHLRQHDRLDAEAADVIDRARGFDMGDGPLNRHLVSVDVTDDRLADEWAQQVALHAAMHETDGSLPLRPDDTGELHRI
jgi:MFS family permease